MSSSKQYSKQQEPIPPSSSSSSSYYSNVPNHSNNKDSRRSLDISGKRRIPREVRFGNYVLGSTLGEGEFGKVKLGWRKDGKLPSQAAIKLIKRDSIPTGSEKEGKIYREITALKKLRHPNIVRLVEVLQNDKYIGIVLEYASGGELFDYILDHRYLKESLACRLFAQLVSGVDYMHAKGIVHRDLKLENLLLDKHKNIIITDFGFVNSFHNANNDLMKTSCGSPCYAAPELVVSSEPYEGKKVDIWSCGVILYAMLAGYLPFDDDPENPDGSNIARLYHYITHTPLTFPEYIQPTPRDLLRRILVSNPNKRINLKDIRSHQWLAPHAPFLSVTPMEWDRNYRSTKVLTQQDKINRRMSLMENPTSASLMLNKQSVRSYSTHNVQAALYSNPAAPQTSHTVAIPSAEASPVTSPVRQTKVPSSSSSNNVVTSSSSANGPTRHSRSGSTASIALQAVVDADVEIKRRYSNGSDVLTTPVRNTNQRPISFVPILSDNKNFETIKESPEHQKVLPPPIPVFNKPANSTMKLPSSRANKPRPTSYHPSYTASNVFNSSELSFIATTNFSESSLKATGRPKIGNSSTYSSTTESLISNSLRDISPAETDNTGVKLYEVNEGKTPSVTENTSTTVPTIQEKQNNGNSYAMDLLTNAMDTLSMISKGTTQASQNAISSSTNLEENHLSPATAKAESITDSPDRADTTINNNADGDNKDTTLLESDDSEKENVEEGKSDSAKSKSNSPTNNHKVTQPTPTLSTASGVGANAGAAGTKYKRFSLLTFYQSIPEPTAPGNYVINNVDSIAEDVVKSVDTISAKQISTAKVASLPKVTPAPKVYSEPSYNPQESNIIHRQRKVTPNNGGHQSVHAKGKTARKPLEPSNVKSDRRVSSVYVQDKAERNEKETSTARKVMDFFKRRSMRI